MSLISTKVWLLINGRLISHLVGTAFFLNRYTGLKFSFVLFHNREGPQWINGNDFYVQPRNKLYSYVGEATLPFFFNNLKIDYFKIYHGRNKYYFSHWTSGILLYNYVHQCEYYFPHRRMDISPAHVVTQWASQRSVTTKTNSGRRLVAVCPIGQCWSFTDWGNSL